MKIYTKTGDKGKTSLFSGRRVAKHDLRIESYGSIDELNSYIGVVKDHAPSGENLDLINKVQDRLFNIGSILATETEKIKNRKIKIPKIHDTDIEELEKAMDVMNEQLPKMTHFLLPGGHPVVSFCHVARCVCRRAERRITALAQEETVDTNVLKYVNRLSDFLFVLSRYWGKKTNAKEVKWIPKID
ncbi:cob(I)yrinic acid a,c-diamide adenosyltransferase [Flavobacterium sp. CS20]|jgi:cob(I)alamin adenosyltransferase|uniref:cob(I)yrinic acid a,c-diamide adenosyltransferase n=1 Tax=Flavobacterium sp. CS20 TaxID=2775246 RepID=UPI001B3A1974|nr:cob(I)yrinic acid a,c-diamide adenosyltransferase [Flavobacterium sp. CS20]QTY26386.1 cob(I)yrinic acid a,c-diamide adenosyltransferase [Flavobacterium sp. CS20]